MSSGMLSQERTLMDPLTNHLFTLSYPNSIILSIPQASAIDLQVTVHMEALDPSQPYYTWIVNLKNPISTKLKLVSFLSLYYSFLPIMLFILKPLTLKPK